MINPSIFKAYDVRGLYPQEVNEDAARLIGRGFAAYLGAKRIGTVAVKVALPSSAGIGGKGEARRTMAVAALSRMACPVPRLSLALSTRPDRSIVKLTSAEPIMCRAAASGG